MAWLQAQAQPEPLQVEAVALTIAEHEAARDKISVPTLELNASFFAYVCHKNGLTGRQFTAVSQAAFSLKAELPAARSSQRFFTEVGDAASAELFLQVLKTVRASPVLCIAVDEASTKDVGLFAVRVHCQITDRRPMTFFWQAFALACLRRPTNTFDSYNSRF
jgi:hypothetical protein